MRHTLTVLLTLATLAALAHTARGSMNAVGSMLYVGDQKAAANLDDLRSAEISAILNVAWDLDIRYPIDAYTGSMNDFNEHLNQMQYAKAGLVDGKGNSPAALASALLQLHNLATVRTGLSTADKAKYPEPVKRILVHCHSGMSRSVTVAATYLTLINEYSTFDKALAAVLKARNLSAEPNADVLALARSLLASGFSLTPGSGSGSGSGVTSTGEPTTTTAGSSSGEPSTTTTTTATGSSGAPATTSASATSGDDKVAVGAAKSKSMSAGGVVLLSFFVVFIVFAAAALFVVRRHPDSPAAGTIRSVLACRVCRRGGPSSAYSMTTPPAYDF